MSTHSLKYPYQWAKTPVNSFVEKYARGTYNLSKILSIAPGEIRHYLCLILAKGRSLKWESMKKVIMLLEDYNPDQIKRYTQEERILLYRYVRYLCEDDALDEKKPLEELDSP